MSYLYRLLSVLCVVLVLAATASAAPKRVKEQYFDQTGRKHYKVALHITNPLGAMSKVGAGLEIRTNNSSIIPTYKMYYGAFKGKQYGVEWEHFFKGKTKNQWFFYMKGIMGDTVRFVNKSLSLFGHTQEIEVGPQTYIGGGLGIGRRYDFHTLFIDWQLGLKYCVLDGDVLGDDTPEYEKAQQHMFRLFRFTGPGSIVDAHVTLGIQL